MKLRIKELMEHKQPRWTYEDLADASGLSTSVLSRLASGKRRFNQGHVEKLAAAFKVEPAELFEGQHTDHQVLMIRELFDMLSPEDRELVLDHMRFLASRKQAQAEHT